MKIQITLTVETEIKPKMSLLVVDLKDVLVTHTRIVYSEIDALVIIDNKVANSSY